MRVMVAPDSFGETLTATEAADAIGRGWLSARPDDEVLLAPQSDGGPGFVDVLATRLGTVKHLEVDGPVGRTVDAAWLLDGSTAYIEAASACGLALLGGPPTLQSALNSSSFGVGQLIAAALGEDTVNTVYVGLGGSSCTDGGRGMIRALGGLTAATERLRGVDLVAATDVENHLLGEFGAAHVFGPQKGADAEMVETLEGLNRDWAAVLEFRARRDVAELAGAGAAGGIGAALFALGGRRESGAAVVAEVTDQQTMIESVELVVTGEGKFDSQSLRGKLVTRLAAAGGESGIESIVLAGQVLLDAQQLESAGISRAYSVTEFAGSIEKSMSDAGNQLELLAGVAAAEFEPRR
ncbi:glycerate kinase [Rhodococcus sp. G-MC3]|uniref:glycerate kinase family protein n=1 Tax=Rhodococcus sp. G-MC3 TaxID=3046209 RepID=UPI0024BAE9BE|nr:glycerate kinase [Rhodococcus sp. G-MC3]MDJ0393037.1 glycerate kinase [Rhodococcus sp. G-MC3]